MYASAQKGRIKAATIAVRLQAGAASARHGVGAAYCAPCAICTLAPVNLE
jgi:hypothetical protein